MWSAGPAPNAQLQLSTSSFEPTSGPPKGNLPTQVTLTIGGGTTVVWDGTADNGVIVPSGQYFIQVSSKDGEGGETVLSAHVMVLSDNPNAGLGNLTARPNLANPKSGYRIQFVSDSALSLTLEGRVYDAAGELVVGNLSGPAGSNLAFWDASGVASGLYFALLEARDPQGVLAGRKSLKIVVVR